MELDDSTHVQHRGAVEWSADCKGAGQGLTWAAACEATAVWKGKCTCTREAG